MTYTSYPFDNQDTTEAQYSALFRELQDSGVIGGYGDTALAVGANSSAMTVTLQPGSAIVRGFYFNNDAVATLTIGVSGAAVRYDAIVLQLDPTLNSIVPVVKANAGQTPALTQTATGVYEILLAIVTVPANAVTIAAGNVADTRAYVGSRIGTWTTSTRPSPRKNMIGRNETTGVWETYNGTAWAPMLITGRVVDAAARTAISTAYGANLPKGYRVRQTDDEATYEWDGTVWVPWDSKWQTYTPNVSHGGTTPFWNAGNATATGRYFRKGREVTVEGDIIVGTTTSFTGAPTGPMYVTVPTTAAPSNWASASGGATVPSGTCWVSNGGTPFGFVGVTSSATPGDRRIRFYNPGGTVLTGATGTAGSWNIWTAGQRVVWSASFDTNLE